MDLAGIEGILLSLHTMAAIWTRVPEIALAPEEAKTLSEAIGRVQRHYDVIVSEKTLDIMNLVSVAGMVYGPRAMAIYLRVKQENAAHSAVSFG